MTIPDLQYLTDEDDTIRGMFVPIAVWKEISSEIETRHLSKSGVMRRRILESMAEEGGLSLEEVLHRAGIEDSAASAR